jgi:hypothetical protein
LFYPEVRYNGNDDDDDEEEEEENIDDHDIFVVIIVIVIVHDDDYDVGVVVVVTTMTMVRREGGEKVGELFLRNLMKLCLNIENIAGFCNLAAFQFCVQPAP